VIEVYPQIRFFTEVRLDGKPFATMVAGMPESSKQSGSFDGMQGSFFSSANADEAILQMEFAKELNPQTAQLIGKDLVLRYAERQSLAADSNDPAQNSADLAWCRKKTPANYRRGGNRTSLRLWRLRQRTTADSTFRRGNFARRTSQRSARRFARLFVFGQTGIRQPDRAREKSSLVDATEAKIKNLGFGAFSLLDASKSLAIFSACLTCCSPSSAAWRWRSPPWASSTRW